MPSVHLTLKNANTGDSRTATSSGSGDYSFSLVLPGTYELIIEQSGFTAITVNGLVVQVVLHD